MSIKIAETVLSKEMPRYQSHKVVHALKIGEIKKDIVHPPTGMKQIITLAPADSEYPPFEIPDVICARYFPVPGDYYVVYDDGYASISPAKAFEEGYTRLADPPTISEAGLLILRPISEASIEQTIVDKGLKAPRLRPQDIDAVIVSETYTTLPSRRTMICELTLRNGFTVLGEANVISVENFDEDLARDISKSNARRNVWQYEAYLLKEKLSHS